MVTGTYVMKSIDQGWIEVIDGQGGFLTVMMARKANQAIQFKIFNFLIVFIVRLVFVMYFFLHNY